MLLQSFKFLSVDMKLSSLSVIIIVYFLPNVRYQWLNNIFVMGKKNPEYSLCHRKARLDWLAKQQGQQGEFLWCFYWKDSFKTAVLQKLLKSHFWTYILAAYLTQLVSVINGKIFIPTCNSEIQQFRIPKFCMKNSWQ